MIVYELLDEVLDAGFPLATEPNILKELIKPSSIMRSITNTVTGKSNVSESLPSGQLSNVPWRRAGVKYSNNEAFFDIKEDVSRFPTKIYKAKFVKFLIIESPAQKVLGTIKCC